MTSTAVNMHGLFKDLHGFLTSMIGLEASTFSSTFVSLAEPPTVAKKRMAYFAETVFPAPDSPLTIMDWFLSSLQSNRTKRKRDFMTWRFQPRSIHTDIEPDLLQNLKNTHEHVSTRLYGVSVNDKATI